MEKRAGVTEKEGAIDKPVKKSRHEYGKLDTPIDPTIKNDVQLKGESTRCEF